MPGLVHWNTGEPVDGDTLHQRGSYFWSGTAGFRVVQGHASFLLRKGLALNIPHVLEAHCWVDGCPPSPFDPGSVMIIDPETVFAPSPGFDPGKSMTVGIPGAKGTVPFRGGEVLGTAANIVAGAWTNPDRVYVGISEPRAIIADRTTEHTQLRAVVFERSSGLPLQIVAQNGEAGDITGMNVRVPPPDPTPDLPPLTAAQFDAVYPKHRWGCKKLAALPDDPSRIGDRDGVALSALRNEALIFGGFSGGAPRAAALLFDLAGSFETIELPPDSRPGEVLAAAYHFADDAYCEVDRLGNFAKVRRFSLDTRRFDVVATLPAAWVDMDQYWLVSGFDGDLYVAGTRDQITRLARFVPSEGKLVYEGQITLPHRIVARPLAHFGRVAVVREPKNNKKKKTLEPGVVYGGPVRETLLVSQFHP